jgi:hypothetical protein
MEAVLGFSAPALLKAAGETIVLSRLSQPRELLSASTRSSMVVQIVRGESTHAATS